MGRKKKSEPELKAETAKKPRTAKKRETRKPGPLAGLEPKAKAKPGKKQESRETSETVTRSVPVPAIEQEKPVMEPAPPASVKSLHTSHAPHRPQRSIETLQNMMAGAGLCTFVGSVVFSYGRSDGRFLVETLGVIVGLAGYLQLLLVAKSAPIKAVLDRNVLAWLVLVAIIISTIIFGVQLADLGRSRSRSDETVGDAGPTPTPVQDISTQILPDGRALLVGVAPENLSSMPRRFASTEVEKMMLPLWSKWIRLDGVVKDIRNDDAGSGPGSASLLIQGPSVVSVTYFSDAKQIERLGQLKKRDPVKVMCQITPRYTAGDYSFEKCELVD